MLLTRYITDLQYFYPIVVRSFFGDNGNRLACFGAFFLRLLCLLGSLLCLRRNNDHVLKKKSLKNLISTSCLRWFCSQKKKNLYLIFEYVKICLTNCATKNVLWNASNSILFKNKSMNLWLQPIIPIVCTSIYFHKLLNRMERRKIRVKLVCGSLLRPSITYLLNSLPSTFSNSCRSK